MHSLENKVEHLTSAVRALVNDGAFKAISQRWFGYDVSKPRVAHSMGS